MKKFVFIFLVGFAASVAHGGTNALTLPAVKPLKLQDALILAIENNLDIKIRQMDIPISEDAVIAGESVFDPLLDASVLSSYASTPAYLASVLSKDLIEDHRGVSVGIGKKSTFGLTSRLSAQTWRLDDTATAYQLLPEQREYRNYLVLELNQPLLKDFGRQINTTDLRVAQNQQKQFEFGYLSRINQIVRSVETTYYDLAKAMGLLKLQEESRELARTLLDNNRKKFEAGVIPVSEVQRAETALAGRDEMVLIAGQQVEIISDRLKDLLNIRDKDPVPGKKIDIDPVHKFDQALPEIEQAMAKAFQKRPELLQQAIEIEIRDIKMAYFKNQKLPRIDLGATLGLNGLGAEKWTASTPDSEYVGNYKDSLKSLTEGDGYAWAVGVNVAYPLGNRAAKARFRQAEQEKSRAIYQYQRIESACETEVKNAWINAKRSLERIDVAGRFESLAAVTLDQEMQRLAQGLSDTFRILYYQDDLIEAKIRKITAITDFNKGISDLYYATGDILDRHLMTARLNPEGDIKK
jgi:outer membrane protein TolC